MQIVPLNPQPLGYPSFYVLPTASGLGLFANPGGYGIGLVSQAPGQKAKLTLYGAANVGRNHGFAYQNTEEHECWRGPSERGFDLSLAVVSGIWCWTYKAPGVKSTNLEGLSHGAERSGGPGRTSKSASGAA